LESKSAQAELLPVYVTVHALYGFGLICAVLVLTRIQLIPPAVGPETGNFLFFILLAVALIEFGISFLIFGKKIHVEKPEDFPKARTSTILTAAMGEAIGLYGFVLYLLTGDTLRPWFFFGLMGFHYMATMMKLRALQTELERL
jgi:hypothetical protein